MILSGIDVLTPRQQEIVLLRCREGLSGKETAKRLYLSPQTVKNHVTQILRRTGATAVDQLCYRVGYETGQLNAVPVMRPEHI